MKYKIMREADTEKGYGEKGLVLGDIFSIRKEGDSYILTEECDGWYKEILSKEAVLRMLDELKSWVETN